MPTDSALDAGPAPDIASFDWDGVRAALDTQGWAVLRGLLAGEHCRALGNLYADDSRFRTTVTMSRHGFGSGEYRYFAYPLPGSVAALRTGLYRPLSAIANRWSAALGEAPGFPADHAGYLRRCHSAGQTRPTPLLLSYGPGDFNCLHQDLYGEMVFPLQVTVLLSRPGGDFEGGEFVLTEQRPRMQSRAEVVPLGLGDAVVFPVRHRPVQGSRGTYRANIRHGVSRVRSGRRRTLGVIFHDAA